MRRMHLIIFLFITAFGAFTFADPFFVSAQAQGASPFDRPFMVLSNLDQQYFKTCGSCGNSRGNGVRADYQQQMVTSPSLDGNSTEFSIASPSGAHGNAYWYIKRKGEPGQLPQKIVYEFSFYVPVEDAGKQQAIEFATGMRWTDGYMYRFAWQMNFRERTWRVYDPTLHRWVETGLSFPGLKYGQWNTVMTEGRPDVALKRSVGLALTFNGVRETTSVTTGARREPSNEPYLVNAFQLDSNKNGEMYRVYVDLMRLSLY